MPLYKRYKVKIDGLVYNEKKLETIIKKYAYPFKGRWTVEDERKTLCKNTLRMAKAISKTWLICGVQNRSKRKITQLYNQELLFKALFSRPSYHPESQNKNYIKSLLKIMKLDYRIEGYLFTSQERKIKKL